MRLELLRMGMRKVVGDGQTIDAFRDPWIPRPRTFRPITMDVDAILGIPLGSSDCADRWCWHYSSNGSYTVKSGYAVALDVVPQKVKIFLWRMYHQALPTNSQLIRRKVLVQPVCRRCGEESETPEHALVFCSSLLPLWTKLRVWHYLYRGRAGSLAELLVYLFDVISKDEFELVSMSLRGRRWLSFKGLVWASMVGGAVVRSGAAGLGVPG
ncbi:hypothetical protein G4B88_026646 [Cannabis sativa]|uniref:Reverse transcriptase zinc-binding domain-containing protein n=1 Tax=Cannabis sativa TaxID=3483 RepID=A0A7J6GR07_CANSA|nr:hypothetical protein G4B88_026646 [Cannabis sativa]